MFSDWDHFQIEAWPIAIFGLVWGAVWASFANTVADRLPEGQSILRPGSACPECRRRLAWWELIPILSWSALRGRCRTCDRRIGPRTLLVEILGGLMGVWTVLRWGFGPAAVMTFLAGWCLLTLGVLDLERRLLPDRLTLFFWALGLVWKGWLEPVWSGTGTIWPSLLQASLGALVLGGLLALVGFVYRRLTGRIGLGGGDPKLAAGLGAWLGPQSGLEALVLGAGLGAAVGLVLVLTGRAGFKTALPLGSFLCGSGLVVLMA